MAASSMDIGVNTEFAGWTIKEILNCAQYRQLREDAGLPNRVIKNSHFLCENNSCKLTTYMERKAIRNALERNANVMSNCQGCQNGERLNNNTCYYANKIRDKTLTKIPDRTPKVKVGDRYGMFKVLEIESSGSYADHQCRAVIKCCSCGRIQKRRFDTILGCAVACECNKSHSTGETLVIDYCVSNNIPFVTEYSFDGLFGTGGGALRYDVAIIKNNDVIALIEFDGAQHYTTTDFFGGEEAFLKRVAHDSIKDDYAKSHNIPLIRIKEEDKINITSILDNFLKNIK